MLALAFRIAPEMAEYCTNGKLIKDVVLTLRCLPSIDMKMREARAHGELDRG